jgi:hypothetical protein
MKFVIVIAASVASAALETPTVTQGQSGSETPKAQPAATQAAQPLRA